VVGVVSSDVEETRERLTKRREEFRERLSGEELRRAYESLVERGEAAMEASTRKRPPSPRPTTSPSAVHLRW
jgi:hypothetical protein